MSPLEHLKYVRVSSDKNGLWCSACLLSQGGSGNFYEATEPNPTLIELNNAAAQHIHNGAVRHDIHQETASGDTPSH